VVLAGPAGVGKTRLAAEFIELPEMAGMAILRVIATRASAPLPLGVFAPLLTEAGGDGPETTGTTGPEDRVHLILRCAAAMVAAAAGRPLVLMVDNVQLLDDGSATLVHQMVAARQAFVVATLLGDEPVPEPVARLWSDDLVVRMELTGLTLPRLEQLLESVLEGPVDPAMAKVLAERSKGNVLFFRELVIGAIADGSLIREMGIWRLNAPVRPSNRLIELVEGRLAQLDPDERRLLELISLGEPLGTSELTTLIDPTLAEGLERKGFLRGTLDGRRLQIRLAHPVYGDVIRGRTPVMRVRQMCRDLAAAVESTGARRREDILRIATWRLVGGGGEPDLLYSAAITARQRFDFPLAERLAREAVSAGAGFDAAVLATQLAFLVGRGDDAEAELVELTERAADDRQRYLVAMTWLDHRLFEGGTVARGLRAVEEAEATVQDAALRTQIAAKRAAAVAGVEGPSAGAALAAPLLNTSRGTSLVWASIAAGYSLGRTGRLRAAIDAAEQGLSEHERTTGRPEWHPWSPLFTQAEALANSGRLDQAHSLVLERHQRALSEGSPEAQALFSWQLCKMAGDRGYPHTAARHGRTAVALFRQLGQLQFVHFALGHLSTALALSGDVDAARAALTDLDSLGIGLPMYWACDVLQARAWTAAAAEDLPAAIESLRESQHLGESIGDHVGESVALHAMARLGRADLAIDRLSTVAPMIEGELAATRLLHVTAIVEHDPARAERAVTTFHALGALMLAAEASADAATGWLDRGEARRAKRAEHTSAALARACENPATPKLSGVRDRVRLTPAELQVAQLAAGGVGNKDIAARLYVSRRTVENQLHHVYDKLGVSGRNELARVLDLETDEGS
jgi:DNA-binding CsgD family transcriptional regulator